jgi:PIN domain nuclease of toxin-antitoxin system
LSGKKDAPAGGGLLVSAISWWEVAMLTQRVRLALNMEVEPWLALVAALPAVQLLPLDPLLSADSKILAYSHVQSLW